MITSAPRKIQMASLEGFMPTPCACADARHHDVGIEIAGAQRRASLFGVDRRQVEGGCGS